MTIPRGFRTLALGLLVLAGCGRPADSTSHSQAPPTAPAAEAPNRPAAAPQVTIDNFTYGPRQLTVSPGTRVTWVNRDDVPHTVTSLTKPRLLDSKALDSDESFSFTFVNPGTYDYFCTIHPKMTGKIIVK